MNRRRLAGQQLRAPEAVHPRHAAMFGLPGTSTAVPVSDTASHGFIVARPQFTFLKTGISGVTTRSSTASIGPP